MAQEDDYDRGIRFYNKGDYKTAYTYFQKGTDEGDFNCMNMLGGMYHMCEGEIWEG